MHPISAAYKPARNPTRGLFHEKRIQPPMELWLKALHIIFHHRLDGGDALYLPRLFVYHAEAPKGSALPVVFLTHFFYALRTPRFGPKSRSEKLIQ